MESVTLRICSCAKRTADGSSFHRTPCPQLLGTRALVAPMARPLLDSRPGVMPHEVDGWRFVSCCSLSRSAFVTVAIQTSGCTYLPPKLNTLAAGQHWRTTL